MITKEKFPDLNKIIQGFQSLTLSGPDSENMMRFFKDRLAEQRKVKPSAEVRLAIRAQA